MLDNDGYKYQVVKNRPQKTYYECVFKTTQHCPATAVVLKATDIIISQNGKHNHDNNLLCEQVWMLVQQLRTEENSVVRKIKDSTVSTNSNTSRNLGRVQKHFDLQNIVSTYGKTPLKVYMDSILAFYNR